MEMEYKEKYEQLHKFISDLYPFMSDYCKEKAEGMIPELKESDDEKIRKELISHFDNLYHDNPMELPSQDTIESWISWLEKQGEQKLYVNDNAKEMFIKALERVEEENSKGYKLTDCDKNSWWKDFKAYATSEQNPANSAKISKDEHKPAWNKDDEGYFCNITAILEAWDREHYSSYLQSVVPKCIEWLTNKLK